jgi:hypothetical protein
MPCCIYLTVVCKFCTDSIHMNTHAKKWFIIIIIIIIIPIVINIFLSSINVILSFSSLDSLKVLYVSLIRSKLDYASANWNNLTLEDSYDLENTQRMFVDLCYNRFFFQSNSFCNYESMLNNFDRLCGLVVRVPGYRSRGPGSIPGSTRFCEK